MKQVRYSPEVRERAVRMVFETRGDGQSLWSAVESVAAKIGCAAQTLNEWVKQHQRDAGQREGATTTLLGILCGLNARSTDGLASTHAT